MPQNTENKNPIFEAIDEMPFAGKTWAKEAWVSYETAPDKRKTRRLLGASALFGAMAVAHGIQSKYGMDSFAIHFQDALQSQETKDGLFASVDAMYAIAMGGVAVRQIALIGELAKKHGKWFKERHAIPESERVPARREISYSNKALAAMAGVTLVGSGLGIASGMEAHSREPLEDLRPISASEAIYTQHDQSKELYETNTIRIEQPVVSSRVNTHSNR